MIINNRKLFYVTITILVMLFSCSNSFNNFIFFKSFLNDVNDIDLLNENIIKKKYFFDDKIDLINIFFMKEITELFHNKDYSKILIRVSNIKDESFYEIYIITIIDKKINLKHFIPEYNIKDLNGRIYISFKNDDFKNYYNYADVSVKVEFTDNSTYDNNIYKKINENNQIDFKLDELYTMFLKKNNKNFKKCLKIEVESVFFMK